jgi:hypothetical protein
MKKEKAGEVERLSKIIEEMQKSQEFFSTIARAVDLVGFEIEHCGRDLSGEQLGRLVAAFNARFSFALLVQPYGSNDMRGCYRLLAVRDYSQVPVWTMPIRSLDNG